LMLIKSKSRGFSTVDETSRWLKHLDEIAVVESLVCELPANSNCRHSTVAAGVYTVAAGVYTVAAGIVVFHQPAVDDPLVIIRGGMNVEVEKSPGGGGS